MSETTGVLPYELDRLSREIAPIELEEVEGAASRTSGLPIEAAYELASNVSGTKLRAG